MGAPKGNAGLRILLPGRGQPLPGGRRETRKCGLPAAAVSGRAEGGSRGWGSSSLDHWSNVFSEYLSECRLGREDASEPQCYISAANKFTR